MAIKSIALTMGLTVYLRLHLIFIKTCDWLLALINWSFINVLGLPNGLITINAKGSMTTWDTFVYLLKYTGLLGISDRDLDVDMYLVYSSTDDTNSYHVCYCKLLDLMTLPLELPHASSIGIRKFVTLDPLTQLDFHIIDHISNKTNITLEQVFDLFQCDIHSITVTSVKTFKPHKIEAAELSSTCLSYLYD
ncbi:Hypothetical protein MVR_LOCUS147 [uncultured virus]|nr:Hypothetical protein MVR_LOCUS147 [uncultured virus]